MVVVGHFRERVDAEMDEHFGMRGALGEDFFQFELGDVLHKAVRGQVLEEQTQGLDLGNRRLRVGLSE